jgi:Flp pilus assembly pilin Flp
MGPDPNGLIEGKNKTMKRIIKKCIGYIRNYEGVAAIEFALIAPPLIMFMVGILDYGMYMNTQMQLENTARTAAQYIVQGGDPNNVEQDVVLQSRLQNIENYVDEMNIVTDFVCECRDGTEVDCDTDDPGGVCDEDDYMRRFIEVTLATTYDPLMPYPGITGDNGNIALGGTARMQLE